MILLRLRPIGALWALLAAGLLLSNAVAAGAAEETPATPVSLTVSGPDLALTQKRSGECRPGDECAYALTITNEGEERFTGVLNILRTASYRPSKHKSAEDVACSRKRTMTACRTERLRLKPGEAFSFTLSQDVPRSESGEVRDCALLAFRGGEFGDPYEDLVAIVQLALKSRGLYADGEIDGKAGTKFRAAIDSFRESEEMPEGEIDADLIKALFGPAGLMVEDVNPDNDLVCDSFELAEPAKANRRHVRRYYRRYPTRRQVQQRGFSARNSGDRNGNIRLDGFDGPSH